jgi:hypothetical protein
VAVCDDAMDKNDHVLFREEIHSLPNCLMKNARTIIGAGI